MRWDLVHPWNLYEVSMRSQKLTFGLYYASWNLTQRNCLFRVTVTVRFVPHYLPFLRYEYLPYLSYLQSCF